MEGGGLSRLQESSGSEEIADANVVQVDRTEFRRPGHSAAFLLQVLSYGVASSRGQIPCYLGLGSSSRKVCAVDVKKKY